MIISFVFPIFHWQLEIDVFLDPHLVQRIEIVLDARNEILDGLQSGSKKNAAKNKRFSERMDAVEKLLTPHERSILGFFNSEIKKRVNVLVENMLIAHGNGMQLILEQTGYLKQYNFSRVRHMRRTLGGGIIAEKWITLYAEALRMSTKVGDNRWPNDEDNWSETSSPSCNTNVSSPKVATLGNEKLRDSSTTQEKSTKASKAGVSPLMEDSASDKQDSTSKSTSW